MINVHRAARLLRYIVLAIALMMSPPTSLHEEYTTYESIPESAAANQGNKPKLATRKHSSLLHKLMVTSQSLPILFVVLHLILNRIPLPRLNFKPCIFILLKRLFMTPIRFTSTFVSVNTSLAV
ncbi:hypothetical protein BK127_38550 [Paenibacillus sp. FSL H7-0331]|nr:hypothetical protein BK127_38550 [Paenibacillus sp. FSL H7-0331]